MAFRLTIVAFLSALTLTSAACVGDSCNTVPSDETSMLQVHHEVHSHTNSSIDEDERALLSPREGGYTGEEEGAPCAGDIADGRGAGYACCKKLSKSDIKKQPLCGVCLRNEQGAAGKYSDCANVYCQAADGVSSSLLKKIAKACSPDALGLNTPPEGMIAIVANNPEKEAMADFLADHKAAMKRYNQYITGTKNSGKMCFAVTKAQGAAFNTESGPYGGDAELAGILAHDKVYGTEYIDGLIFFNDPSEAHKIDINALLNIVEDVLPRNRYGYSESDGRKVLKTLGIKK